MRWSVWPALCAALRPLLLRAYIFLLLAGIAVPCSRLAYATPSDGTRGGLVLADTQRAFPGYTVYRTIAGRKIVVLDLSGNVVKTWCDEDFAMTFSGVIQPLPNGHLLALARLDNVPGTEEGDVDKVAVEVDWDGNVVWQFQSSGAFDWLHHDMQRLANGNTLLIASSFEMHPEIAPIEIKNDYILEVDTVGNIVWQWDTMSNFEQLHLSAKAREVIYSGDFKAADISDVFHTNAVQSLPPNRFESDPRFRRGNILVSQRNANTVFIIDKDTSEIVWMVRDRTVGQHHVKMIPEPLSGAGNIMMFDNGGWGGFPQKYRLFTRIIELNPEAKMIEWVYNGNTSKRTRLSFFSPFKGSAQRLPNDNTLIGSSEWGRIFEVTPQGEVVWEYINPYYATGGDYHNRIYRAYRFPEEWLTPAFNSDFWW